jgi:alpha-beta hydrolase superfamily lysophospholipase
MDDIDLAIDLARLGSDADMPLFLYGHSLGALEVLYYGLKKQIDLKGIIATSPPLDLSNTSKAQKILAKILNPIAPGLTMPNGLDTNALSHDLSVVKNYQEDPLVHDKVSVRLGMFLIEGAEYILANAAKWQYPLLLMHGMEDKICNINGSERFFEKVEGDVTYKRWEGLYHETHNEPEKAEVIETMVAWIKDRL